ncbi:MAG: bifunctional 4-hydroxy-2-oxoglutarate aldolase/2-dehydro-3-deoxy-phosphogluconate aldolase [Chloroflexi bacterium RBG_13_68_17]|nr:MAG: bifunctional 4-hydroxy-2-oxoglutarate aldolase/2-dehydro-3-deoxy-phosphogluconate aldolase [Chloroflexi bacterium RBG_13_68_17]
MARIMRLEVYNQLMAIGLLPLFYQGETDTAIEIIAACCRGGSKLVEFTNRGERAYPAFAELVQHFAQADPSVILGIGSVQDAPTAALFIAAGANFVVGPSLNPEIARLCNRRKIAYLPGAATETEIGLAEELGVEVVKVFPGQTVGGPSFIRAVMAPCPWHRLLPTGGVDANEASITSWIAAGAAAVGMGSNLFSTQLLKDRDFDGLAARVADCIGWVAAARNAAKQATSGRGG